MIADVSGIQIGVRISEKSVLETEVDRGFNSTAHVFATAQTRRRGCALMANG